MRHVDDGTIHAWLDREVTDPAEAVRIEEHLRECAECRARLDEARAILEQSESLLAMAAPAGDPPAFDMVASRAYGQASVSALDGAGPASVSSGRGGRGSRRWMIPAGWAASVALAVAIGWTARDLATRAAAPAMEVRLAQAPNDGTTDTSARVGLADGLLEPPRTQAVSEEAVTAADAQLAAPVPAAVDRSRFEAENTAGAVGTPEGVPSEMQAGRGLPALEQDPPAKSTEAPAPAAPPDASVPSGESAAPVMRAPIPGALPSESVTAIPAPAAAPPEVTDRMVTGGLVGMARATSSGVPDAEMEATGWRIVPRTEAAARSGMPLYGIDRIAPVVTATSMDGRTVRTIYRLESGDRVELLQHRLADEVDRSGALLQAARPVRPSSVRAPGVAASDVAAVHEWTATRGNVRVTLNTVSDSVDLDALGSRLQVD